MSSSSSRCDNDEQSNGDGNDTIHGDGDFIFA